MRPTPYIEMEINELVRILKKLRIPYTEDEYGIHERIKRVLDENETEYIHEAVIGSRCRIDFLCGGIGIEVKRGKPDKKRVLAQCSRYAACEKVQGIILVIDTALKLPSSVNGKPLTVIGLNSLWGIALPG